MISFFLPIPIFSKRCVAYINEHECPPQYIADMLRDLADAIMTSYPEVKNNSSNL